MKRTRRMLAFILFLAVLQLLAACYKFRGPGADAAEGGAIGGAIGGPTGAAIGSAAMLALGVFARWQEKRTLRRRGILIDKKFKKQNNIPVDGVT